MSDPLAPLLRWSPAPPQPASPSAPRGLMLHWAHTVTRARGVLSLGPSLGGGLSFGSDPAREVILPGTAPLHARLAPQGARLYLSALHAEVAFAPSPDLFGPHLPSSWNRVRTVLAPGASTILQRAVFWVGPYRFSLAEGPPWALGPASQAPLAACLAAASSPESAPEQLAALAQHFDPAVRAAVADNPSTPVPVLLSLAGEHPARVLHNPLLALLLLESPTQLDPQLDRLPSPVLRQLVEVEPCPAWFARYVATRQEPLSFPPWPQHKPLYRHLAAEYEATSPSLLIFL